MNCVTAAAEYTSSQLFVVKCAYTVKHNINIPLFEWDINFFLNYILDCILFNSFAQFLYVIMDISFQWNDKSVVFFFCFVSIWCQRQDFRMFLNTKL